MFSDLRHAGRLLARAPGFTLTAVLSLALGVGATTTILSLTRAMLFRPLPLPEPERLVRLVGTAGEQEFLSLSYPEYSYLRDHLSSFEGLAADAPIEVSLAADGNAWPGWGQAATGNYFSTLHVPIVLGRGFVESEDRTPGAHPVMVISHRLWQRRFGGDASVVGKEVKLNGRSFTIIGVTGEGFTGTLPGFLIELWVPVMMQATVLQNDSLEDPGARFLMAIGRLKPGVSRQSAQTEVSTLAEQFSAANRGQSGNRSARLESASGVHPFMARYVAPFLALLLGMVGLVLLISCANVANLFLARAPLRSSELAVRASLGASRWRLLRQLLAESLLLSLLGGIGGMVVAVWGNSALERFRPPASIPLGFAIPMDWSVLGFALALSLLSGLTFGLLPAWRASRPDVMEAMRGAATLSGPRRSLLQNALVIAQVAVCLVLLAGTGLLGRSLLQLAVADPGFEARRLLAVSFEPHQIGYTAERAQEFYRALRESLEAMPGVRAVTIALAVPRSDPAPGARIHIEGRTVAITPQSDPRLSPIVYHNLVAADYFEVMGIPVIAGRGFSEQDVPGAPQVVLVSQAFARRYWPGESPLGKQMQLASVRQWGELEPPMEVVGVVRDIKYRSWREAEAMFYLPLAQHPRPDITLHVRTEGDPHLLVEPVRQMVRRLDADLPVAGAQAAEERMAFSLVPARVAGSVLGICGAVALLLATTGIFGVVAYSVSQRMREFGIRLALGAQRRDILRLVVGKGVRLAAAGAAIGLAATLGLGQLLASLLYGVTPTDPIALACAVLLLAGVTVLASYVPARRAVRVDPAVTLRYE